ncbi:hypothetical protein AGOR_G00079270 [Albula goreensis]|uniref:Uncharacterized protein n=1 Tax=Albula goreensis TaxID=1534307 RepID=A0A8T3DMJ0_9TELE|nr:hypothetical protein AGOR_G00079270 [Albula goreensis]
MRERAGRETSRLTPVCTSRVCGRLLRSDTAKVLSSGLPKVCKYFVFVIFWRERETADCLTPDSNTPRYLKT